MSTEMNPETTIILTIDRDLKPAEFGRTKNRIKDFGAKFDWDAKAWVIDIEQATRKGAFIDRRRDRHSEGLSDREVILDTMHIKGCTKELTVDEFAERVERAKEAAA